MRGSLSLLSLCRIECDESGILEPEPVNAAKYCNLIQVADTFVVLRGCGTRGTMRCIAFGKSKHVGITLVQRQNLGMEIWENNLKVSSVAVC